MTTQSAIQKRGKRSWLSQILIALGTLIGNVCASVRILQCVMFKPKPAGSQQANYSMATRCRAEISRGRPARGSCLSTLRSHLLRAMQ